MRGYSPDAGAQVSAGTVRGDIWPEDARDVASRQRTVIQSKENNEPLRACLDRDSPVVYRQLEAIQHTDAEFGFGDVHHVLRALHHRSARGQLRHSSQRHIFRFPRPSQDQARNQDPGGMTGLPGLACCLVKSAAEASPCRHNEQQLLGGIANSRPMAPLSPSGVTGPALLPAIRGLRPGLVAGKQLLEPGPDCRANVVNRRSCTGDGQAPVTPT